MKQKLLNAGSFSLRLFAAATVLLIFSASLFSFKARKMAGDFLTELGTTKQGAEEKITRGILGGAIDIYGLKNVKNIALGNRAAVVKDLLVYTKQYVNSAGFIKSYNEIRENNKPKLDRVETPEEMQQRSIAQYKKSIADTEKNLKKADASVKRVFENVLKMSKQRLAEAEDPNNSYLVTYRKNYERIVKQNQLGYDRLLTEWEANYPQNHLLFVKKRLQQFLDETGDIDFSAELTTKNGKKVFVNPVYERKVNRWKMAYRAGKDAVTAARVFAEQWMQEIKETKQ